MAAANGRSEEELSYIRWMEAHGRVMRHQHNLEDLRISLERPTPQPPAAPEAWPPGSRYGIARAPWAAPFVPTPEPLDGPGYLSYVRIVRLEWECGIRTGSYDQWYRDVVEAENADLKWRDLDRPDDDSG